MIDRIFFPALVFVVLTAATAAFASDAVQSTAPQARQAIVKLETVIVTRHDAAAPTVTAAAAAESATAQR